MSLDFVVPQCDLMHMARTETKLRLPEELHSVLTEEAERRGVSLNALATIILSEWVDSIHRLRVALEKARREKDGS